MTEEQKKAPGKDSLWFVRRFSEDTHMDPTHGPLYVRPIVPLHLRPSEPAAPQRLQGTVVGVRAGRSGEVGTTQIVTIKLTSPVSESNRLLHADIELVVRPRR